MRRNAGLLMWWMVFTVAGCTVIAGLDKDFTLITTETQGQGGSASATSNMTSGSDGSLAGGASEAGAESVGSAGMGGAGGAGGGTVSKEVQCDLNTICPTDNLNACCWNWFGYTGKCVQGPPDNDGCDASFDGEQETLIKCKTSLQCGSGFCCGDRYDGTGGGANYYFQISCQPECEDIRLCDKAGEAAPDCPMITGPSGPIQSICKSTMLLPPGFLVCDIP